MNYESKGYSQLKQPTTPCPPDPCGQGNKELNVNLVVEIKKENQ